MNELGVQPNSVTYSFLINMFTADGNLELALRYFHEMKSLKLMPSAKSVQTLVLLAAELSLARLAIDIADWYESAATKSMGQHVWMKCLVASAQEYYVSPLLSFPCLFSRSLGGWSDALLENHRWQDESHAR